MNVRWTKPTVNYSTKALLILIYLWIAQWKRRRRCKTLFWWVFHQPTPNFWDGSFWPNFYLIEFQYISNVKWLFPFKMCHFVIQLLYYWYQSNYVSLNVKDGSFVRPCFGCSSTKRPQFLGIGHFDQMITWPNFEI